MLNYRYEPLLQEKIPNVPPTPWILSPAPPMQTNTGNNLLIRQDQMKSV